MQSLGAAAARLMSITCPSSAPLFGSLDAGPSGRACQSSICGVSSCSPSVSPIPRRLRQKAREDSKPNDMSVACQSHPGGLANMVRCTAWALTPSTPLSARWPTFIGDRSRYEHLSCGLARRALGLSGDRAGPRGGTREGLRQAALPSGAGDLGPRHRSRGFADVRMPPGAISHSWLDVIPFTLQGADRPLADEYSSSKTHWVHEPMDCL